MSEAVTVKQANELTDEEATKFRETLLPLGVVLRSSVDKSAIVHKVTDVIDNLVLFVPQNTEAKHLTIALLSIGVVIRSGAFGKTNDNLHVGLVVDAIDSLVLAAHHNDFENPVNLRAEFPAGTGSQVIEFMSTQERDVTETS